MGFLCTLDIMKPAFQIGNTDKTLLAEPSRAVVNVLAMLESFDDRHREQSLSDISRRLGIPKATALRHLLALQRAGYVTVDARRHRYSLGPQLLVLARRYLAQFDILAQVRPVLAEVAQATGETAHFGVLEGREVVYLEIAEGPHRVRIYVQRGDRLPAHGVAAGKAILAYAPPELRQAFSAAGLPALTDATIITHKAFQAELAATRRRGYALNMGEWINEVVGVSAPVFAQERGVVGAIGVAGLGMRLKGARLTEIAMLVQQHAQRLTMALGGDLAVQAG